MSKVNKETQVNLEQILRSAEPVDQKGLDGYMNHVEKLLKLQLKPEQAKAQYEVVATLLLELVTKSVNTGSLTEDRYGILKGELNPNIFKANFLPGRLENFNSALLKAIVNSKTEATERKEVLSDTEKADILSVDTKVTVVEPVVGEKITIDKANGTISLTVDETKETFTKDIENFNKKSWREIATDLIDKIISGIKKTVSTVSRFVAKPFKALAKRFGKVKEAQPDTNTNAPTTS